mgnify:CR=1 FL=1
MSHETVLRLGVFLGVLIVMALAEAIFPRRARRQSRLNRWSINLALVVLGALAIRLLIPLAAVGAAMIADARGIGLFNLLNWPSAAGILLSVMLLDLAIYAQHVAFHRVPVLWRMHRMHHSDLELDVTSGLRFHPAEYLLSMAIKIGVVLALGAPAAAVVIFEVLLNATAMFNHGNLRLPGWLDRALRTVLVTPDFHIVHHSTERAEHDRNFGFNLTWWDYLFRTYQARPAKGPVALDVGLAPWRAPGQLTLPKLLIQPFIDPPPVAGRTS